MKKLMFSTAAILALSLSAFAGTPEKADAKPEAKVETKTNDPLVYHYTGKTLDGKIQFAEGPATSGCNNTGSVPCEWEATAPMSSPQTEAYINSNAYQILQTRD